MLPARTNRKPDSHRRCPQIDIPHEKFVLSNGLTVIVHEDHSAPLGLRALFEHLMFNGSEHYEKRQGENRPYTKAYELITRAMIPLGHSCDHSVIGSMEDLNAVTLDDVKEWFRTYYGPSNAVLVLAGDITPAQARAKAEKYFGSIQPGAPVAHIQRWVPRRTGTQRETAFDRVPHAQLYRVWNTPEYTSADSDHHLHWSR